MTSHVTDMLVKAHIALLDSDSRILLRRASSDAIWSLPFGQAESHPDASLVAMLQVTLQVQTFAKALFPLTFATDKDILDIVYGCRNWVGGNGLQHVTTTDETLWVKPARLLDHAVTETCRNLLPNLLTLLG